MSQRSFKTDALVLRSRPLGEADRLITLLTWERGKLPAVARGARKTKSKLASGVDLFTYGHFDLYQGRTFATITGQEVKEHFTNFRDDPDLYHYGLFLAGLSDRLIREDESSPDCCSLLLCGWRLLSGGLDRVLLCRAFELKLMALTGYRPHLSDCLRCGSAGAVHFIPGQGGILCRKCADGEGSKLDPGTIALGKRLLDAPLRQVGLIRPGAGQLRELADVTAALFRYHLDISDISSLRPHGAGQ